MYFLKWNLSIGNRGNATIDFTGTKVGVEYKIDGDLLTMDTQRDKVIFKIKNSKTLVGKALSKGVFRGS